MDKKIIICPKCGTTIIGVRDREHYILNRVMKFSFDDGTPYVVCPGRIGPSRACKEKVIIPRRRMFELMHVRGAAIA